MAIIAYAGSMALTSPALAADAPGIKEGKKAPSFNLHDASGKPVDSRKLLQKSEWTALLFYRSADWCPFCKRQLVELQANQKLMKNEKIQVVGISSDTTQILNKFTKKSKITYPLLSDKDGKVMEKFGVRNKQSRGILPHPGLIILDKNGIVKGKLFHDGYRKRHTSAQLIEKIKSLN